jgi:hypothetical protein
MKVGDLVRVKSWWNGADGVEMRLLAERRATGLIVDVRLGDEYAHMLDGEKLRIVPVNRLEVISESR